MSNTQVTLVQIDNYGPWTVTPDPRREPDLQSLQSRLYADLAQAFGADGGYVFYHRFDNMVAITNGIDRPTHARVQESVRNRYPVTVSIGIATDPSPAVALGKASERLQAAGSAQDDARREVIDGDTLATERSRSDDVEIAHFDVNGATEKYTDELNAFASFRRIESAYLALLEYLYDRHDSLSFFVGGDNIIAVGSGLDRTTYGAAVDHVEEAADVELKVGVGRGMTAHEAGMTAKHALEKCRANDTRVEHTPAHSHGD